MNEVANQASQAFLGYKTGDKDLMAKEKRIIDVFSAKEGITPEQKAQAQRLSAFYSEIINSSESLTRSKIDEFKNAEGLTLWQALSKSLESQLEL